MSVLIKGMKMPKNCIECPFSDHEAWCLIPGDPKMRYYCPKEEISEHCPLVEVPEPHGRLIDADALADDLEYDAIHFEEEHEMKSNCASWLRSNNNITMIEAETE